MVSCPLRGTAGCAVRGTAALNVIERIIEVTNETISAK